MTTTKNTADKTASKNSEGSTGSTETVLVLGATGKTGRRLVRRLRADGVPVRAASRSGEVRFDWAEPATWADALTGATAAYVIASDEHPDAVGPFVEQAVAAGVGRFVVLSGRGIDLVGPDFGQGMAAAERAVRESGARWSVIRPNNFAQNFDEDLWREPLRDGRLALPIGDVHEPFVDADDVAEVAAALLTQDGHDGQVYELSGPRGLSFREAAEQIARAAGHPITYVELTPEEYEADLRASGWPEAAVKAFSALFALHRTGVTAAPVDGVRRVLGREAASFEAYVERGVGAGAWS
ncbi:NAD(P)H-binding protein [Streptomyces sp. HU2014]|uniref:NAD(P)H-binding protein n=1 Tax=Streptomyces sp. HU2014 TaxID=2939414 RepID=UPI00200C0E71|nr:NAD(P)H-binding protein [Streptomyces sp. HU2014]UQI48756.1 NAD(P)H-binding protein [Streptomyces sp. HU2014]